MKNTTPVLYIMDLTCPLPPSYKQIVAADSKIIHDFISSHEKVRFEYAPVEVDQGYVTRERGGFRYYSGQGRPGKYIFFEGDIIDWFVVDYYFKIFAGSEYEYSAPDMDNPLYKEIRKRVFDGHFFEGWFSLRKTDYDSSEFNRICGDFISLYPRAKIEINIKKKTAPFMQAKINRLKANKFGIIENVHYTITCDTIMKLYDCIKFDRLIFYPLNKTSNPGAYRNFRDYYMKRKNILIW